MAYLAILLFGQNYFVTEIYGRRWVAFVSACLREGRSGYDI